MKSKQFLLFLPFFLLSTPFLVPLDLLSLRKRTFSRKSKVPTSWVDRKNIVSPKRGLSRTLTLKTEDGLERRAILTLNPEACGNVVLCHPAAQNKEYMENYGKILFPQYNHIRFDFRAHGENTVHQFTTIGKKEVHEVKAAVKVLRSLNETKELPTYGFGISMGAVALIETESKNHLFDGLILQSSYEKLRDQVRRMYRFFQFPLMKHFIFSPMSNYLARLWYNLDMQPVNPLFSIQKISTPIFLIHAQDDGFISFEAFNKLSKAGKSIVKTWTPSQGKHTEILNFKPTEYALHCNEFLSSIKKNKQSETQALNA